MALDLLRSRLYGVFLVACFGKTVLTEPGLSNFYKNSNFPRRDYPAWIRGTVPIQTTQNGAAYRGWEDVNNIPETPPCYNNTNPVDLTTLKGQYVIPFLYAPPYWSTFGNELCKWIDITPDSKNEAHYLGGYYGGNDTTLYKYTGHIQYNDTTGVYDVEEQFLSRNSVSKFTTTPCVVSEQTFMLYISFLSTSNPKECASQTFVFSRNFKTAMEDEGPLRTKCLQKYNIKQMELPYYSNGCRDTGLLQDYY